MKTPSALRLAYIGFAIIGVAVVAAFLAERRPAEDRRHPASPVARANSAGSVPAARPQFTLSDLSGHRRPISEWDGHLQLVNFWATWCVPCRKEIPLLNRMQDEFGTKNLKIIGIAVDFPEDVRKFIDRTPLHYDLLVGEEDALDAAKSYGVESMALPFSAFVDSKGRVLTVHLGELHEPALRATLAALTRFDAGALSREQATAAVEAANATTLPASPAPH